MRGFNVTCYKGAPPPSSSRQLEIMVGTPLPVAFAGLRAIIQGLQEAAPAIVQDIATRYASEWNELFPGTFPGVERLETLALSPSERRLHRESEQVFRVLHVGARVIISALASAQVPLVLRCTGKCDLVSLRAVMYAVEWSRIKPVPGELILAEWSRPLCARLAGHRMQIYAEQLRTRMRAELRNVDDAYTSGVEEISTLPDSSHLPASASPGPVVPESLYFQRMMDQQQTYEVRLAAAACAIRSCFFSTNYEGAFLACEEGLALLKMAGDALDIEAVKQAFRELEPPNATAAIEIDQESLASREDIQTLFLRSAAVVYALMGDNLAARETLAEALEAAPTHASRARLHMLCALLLTKRTSSLQEALNEVQLGLEALQGYSDQRARLEEGWLRNVLALIYVQQRLYEKAFVEEKRALRCLENNAGASATHLKINLISNLSVLQEMLHRYDSALQTWGYFARISDKWDTNFAKHYRYREATLQLKAGRREEALHKYREAYQYAAQLRDSFHQQVIASDLGMLYLEAGDSAQSARWFERAEEAARELGDPFRSGQSMLGYALATQQSDFCAALACLQESTTCQEQARQLYVAATAEERQALLSLLPGPRSKLNRPFDLVNINLFARESATDKGGLVKSKSLVPQ